MHKSKDDMAIERLAERIGRAVQTAQFKNVFGQRFDSTVMRELYARKLKRAYSLSNSDAICVQQGELTNLVSELSPKLVPYRLPRDGAVCNGLYDLMGSMASPRLPSVEDYARTLILAAARIGPEPVARLFSGWLAGTPVRVWLRALLKGVRTDDRLRPVDGLRLETLPGNGDDFPRSLHVQIDECDTRQEQYGHRAMLSLEHEVGPALYLPNRNRDESLQPHPHPTIRNQTLSTVSVGSLCRAMSIEIDGYVDWFMQWWDYGDVDAFFLNAGFSSGRRETRAPSPEVISEEQLVRCLELHGLLEQYKRLDLCIARWLRSKSPLATTEQLVELRIALELILLSDDQGIVGEKRHRLATRGAWLLGETFEERKKHFRVLRDAYDLASRVLHAGSLKAEKTEDSAKTIGESQRLCREAILQIVRAGAMPDWSDVVMGKGFRRLPEDAVPASEVRRPTGDPSQS